MSGERTMKIHFAIWLPLFEQIWNGFSLGVRGVLIERGYGEAGSEWA
jgi:hypothetical protein